MVLEIMLHKDCTYGLDIECVGCRAVVEPNAIGSLYRVKPAAPFHVFCVNCSHYMIKAMQRAMAADELVDHILQL